MASMLDLSKKILTKVSFDKSLFTKEFHKALNYLKPDEKLLLKVWALTTFGSVYRDVIIEVYKGVTKTG
jgi:hypothetical protein